jgi:hypothetical protein
MDTNKRDIARNIWQEFVAELRLGAFSPSRIQPYPGLEDLQATLAGILGNLRQAILSSAERGVEPECWLTGNQVHFILPLSAEKDSPDFCFSFLSGEDRWYFQHVENIFIRLERTGPPPVSVFPDLPEAQKAWARDEIQVSEMVRLFNFLKAGKGKEFALNWFKDGAGYATGVRAWAPFLPLSQAFILYACWDLANLHANPVTLQQLDETSASVSGTLRYFELYERAAHLSRQISREEYQALFETIWQDRARCCGWGLRLEITGSSVSFVFSKQPVYSNPALHAPNS